MARNILSDISNIYGIVKILKNQGNKPSMKMFNIVKYYGEGWQEQKRGENVESDICHLSVSGGHIITFYYCYYHISLL